MRSFVQTYMYVQNREFHKSFFIRFSRNKLFDSIFSLLKKKRCSNCYNVKIISINLFLYQRLKINFPYEITLCMSSLGHNHETVSIKFLIMSHVFWNFNSCLPSMTLMVLFLESTAKTVFRFSFRSINIFYG